MTLPRRPAMTDKSLLELTADRDGLRAQIADLRTECRTRDTATRARRRDEARTVDGPQRRSPPR